ncbi:MAG: inositol monophosphatase [Deltaproteobacteria bacterium]|nr:inositol monophosphatase [Deltaproteobacteria bacterium]
MKDTLHHAFNLAIALARRAGTIQLKHLGNVGRIDYKSEVDIVTEVDRECEDVIVGGIHKKFPDHDILAEEGSGTRSRSSFQWVIDPVDGTVNYAHGFPFFAVSIGVAYEGKPVIGVIYDPNRDELFSAIEGQGATLNAKKIRVTTEGVLRKSLVASGFAYQGEGIEQNMKHFRNFVRSARAVRRPGSAAIDLAYVACGRIDGFWEIDLKAWDMAAGVVIIREAGGQITNFAGGPFDLYGKEILASNGKIHQDMVHVLKGA